MNNLSMVRAAQWATMGSLMSWVRSRLRPSVDGIWCVGCRSRRTVRQVAIIAAGNRRRLKGECETCGGKTSTYIGGEEELAKSLL